MYDNRRVAQPIQPLTHLAALFALALLFYATGYLIEALKRIELPSLGSTVTRIAVGSVAWSYVLFGLASSGGYRPWVALPLALATLAAAAVKAALRGLHPRLPEAPSVAFTWMVLPPAAICAAMFLQALSPEIGWDCNTYHLTLPKLYLARGGFQLVPFNVYSHWPQNVELLYGLAMMLQDYVLAKLVHTLFLGLLLVAVYRICSQHGSPSAALAACLLVLANDVLLFEAPIAYVDIAFGFYLLAAAACVADYLRTGRISVLVLGGFFCGALAGTKLSGIAGIAAVGSMLLLPELQRFELRRLARAALALGVPALLLALPWYVKSFVYTGNPVFPMLYDRLGGIEWSPELNRQFFHWQHSIGMGRSLTDYLLLPWRVVVEADRGYARFDGRLGPFWLAAVPFSIVVARWAHAARPYLVCAGVYFVLWAASSQQLRFLIAVLPLLAIATAIAFDHVADRIVAAPARRSVRAAFFLAACLTAALVAWPRLGGPLAAPALPPSAVVPEAYAFVNARTDLRAKLLLINTNHGFFLDRAYIADSFFEAPQTSHAIAPARSEQELVAILRRLGVTHVYVDGDRPGPRYPPWLGDCLDDPRWFTRVFECRSAPCAVYEITAPGT